jgi:hypothetical protein
MKPLIYKTIGVLTLTFICLTLEAQLLSNGDFENNPSSCPSSSLCGNRINSTCVPNWHRSHGTPQLSIGNTTGTKYIWMTYHGSSATGEGIYYNYNFTKDVEYRICFKAIPDSGTNCTSTGIGLIIKIANGVPETSVSGSTCFEAIPTATSEQTIYTNNSKETTWQEYETSFTPTQNFSQLWIYPKGTSSCNFNVSVDEISIYKGCNKLLVYNNNAVIPSGIHTNYKIIKAGSTNNQITSSVSNANVSLLAGEFVLLEPNFITSPNSGNFFLAAIQPCILSACPSSKNIGVDKVGVVEKEAFENELVQVAPNPLKRYTSFIFNYTLPAHSVINIDIYNINGKKVWSELFETLDTKGQVTRLLDLNTLAAGVYMLKTRIENEVYTKKIILLE